MAPVVAALRADTNGRGCEVAVTAQHREMLDQVLELFDISPDYDLNIMAASQTPTDVLAAVVKGIDSILSRTTPDVVLVQGDTTTALGAALAAYYRRIPVGHIEAGLRTYDLSRPFPEEGNRQMIGRIARWHFAPTESAAQNLTAEGVSRDNIFVTGNTVVDALQEVRARPFKFERGPIDDALRSGRRTVLVTAHRRESWGEPLREICLAVRDIVERVDDVQVVFATHLNPAVSEVVHDVLGQIDRVVLTGPQPYHPFVSLMDACDLILSDSGGIQEEAPSLAKPTLVLREVTERPEGLEAGCVRLVGSNRTQIASAAIELLENEEAYRAMALTANPYGDGRAAKRIVDILRTGRAAC